MNGAVDGADVVFLSIPLPAMAELSNELFENIPRSVPSWTLVTTIPAYAMRIPEIDAGMPESVWASEQLRRPVIKAFNNILAHSLADLGRPEGSPDRLAVAVAGDDAKAKQIVMELVNDTGFDPVDGGSLDEAWRQQPSTPAYCCDYGMEMIKNGIAAAVKGDAPKKRDRMLELFAQLGSNPSHDDIIAMNSSLNPLI